MEFLLEQVLSSLPDGLLIVQPGGTLLKLNPAAERMAGLSEAQAVGRPLTELFPTAAGLAKRIETTLVTGHTFTLREEELLNRLGESFFVEVHLEPIHDTQGKIVGAMVLLRDLTSFKKMEEELRNADRLAVMGTIASGLAHEIKNPLGGIKGAAQMLAREVSRKDLREFLQIITKEADRVNRLISELLSFAKPTKIRVTAVNLHKILDELIQLERQAENSENVEYLRHYDPSLPKVVGDENQLKQAFLNFIKNAREALGKKGKIEISTKLMTGYQMKTERGRVTRMVTVEIRDTGCGMDEKTLSNLFSPFYTTKKGGTGLGLALSHRIISEHQGFIQVESMPKKGSTFRIFLRAQSH